MQLDLSAFVSKLLRNLLPLERPRAKLFFRAKGAHALSLRVTSLLSELQCLKLQLQELRQSIRDSGSQSASLDQPSDVLEVVETMHLGRLRAERALT